MDVPITDAKTIRQVPQYVRWRVRTVKQLIKEANYELARQNKATHVFDWGKFH